MVSSATSWRKSWRCVCFNGSTAPKPWCRSHPRPGWPCVRRFNGATARKPWFRVSVDQDLDIVVLASMGPRQAVVSISRSGSSLIGKSLQWGHGTQAVVSPKDRWHRLPSLWRRFNGATARKPWCRKMACSWWTTKSSFNGSTARKPWCRALAGEGERLPAVLQWGHGTQCVVSFTFGKTFGQLYGPLQWGHGTQAVVSAKRRHLYGRGTAASMGPRHPSRGVDDARTNRTVGTEASMGPRHPSRGVGRRTRRTKFSSSSFNGSTAPKPWCRAKSPAS